ncbi:P-selectin [Geodia barretti]|uniref:p-selectin n=1 Tax=Geodia barretti TaxID=519541 RepID=A0AA35TUE2_GEOBA|nr:P-selectin [Geodia barretti]
MTQFSSFLPSLLSIPGNVTVEYDSSERPVLFHQISSSNAISVQVIALYVQSNKRITLRFTPDNPAIVPQLEGVGEYVRDAAVVNVTNNEALGMAMVTIGFTQRSQTVSEASVLPGRDLLHLPGIAAAAQTPATRDYTVVFEHIEFSSTAIVNGIPVDPGLDALFGLGSGRPLQYLSLLSLGEAIISPPSVAIRNDFVIEELECFTIRIFIEGGVPFMCNNEDTASNFSCTHTICIEDDDGPFIVEFVKTVYTVDESVGSVSVCVNLTRPETDILDETVQVFVIDNPNSTYIPAGAPLASPDPPDFLSRYSMIEGSDYQQQTAALNLIDDILISELNRIICYNQTIYDDTLVEANEYLGLSLGVRDGGSTTVLTLVNPMYGEASILILDNDGPISFGFDATVYTTSESQGMVEVRIVVQTPSTGGTPQPFSVSVSTTDDTAVAPDDYVAITGQIIQFNVGDTSHSLTLSIANDEMCETPNESFFVRISLVSSTGSIAISPSQTQVFIDDVNEPECVPTLSLSSGTYVALENEGSVEVCVVLNIPLNIPLDLIITTTATSSTDGEDFVGGQFPLFLFPGQTQECINITVIDDDTALEGREMFRVDLSTLFFPVPIDISTAEVTIIDNDMVECPTLSDPDNGNVNLSGNTFGQTAEYTCNTGFNLIGDSILICGADGQWTGNPPACEAVQCPTLDSPMNGSLLISGTGVGVYQDTATYACETGFNLVGMSERVCQSDGTWSGSNPTCQSIVCPLLRDPDNGNVNLSGNTFGQTAEYTCNNGFNLVGESILMCGADGQWTGDSPVCEAVQCPTLDSPMNGSLLISGTGVGVYQDTATYACETGFNLVGMSERVCQSDGTWSGSNPTCQSIVCPLLRDPDNGNVNLSGNTFGQTAEYTCNDGFNLVGDSILMCGADGQWTGDSPVCEAVQCPILDSPMNGSVLISGTGVGVYQDTATYACETGFNLVGMSERVCQSDGTWSGSDPTCNMVVCPTLNDPNNGNVELSGNTFGQIAEYTCNTGFNLIGDSMLICGADGQWIGDSPVCEAVSLSCTATGLSEVVAINCSGVGPDTSLQCSFSGGPLHSCNVPILLTSNVSPPGSRFNVTILASTGGEDTVTYDITNTKTDVQASVPPLEVVLTGGSPRVNESSVEAEFVTTRPVTGVRCFLRYENKNDYKDCSSGSVSFTGLKPGRYVLKIFAYNKLTDVAAMKRVVNV